MPGVRIGWLATRDVRFLRRVAELRDYTTICSSAPSQILAMAALQNRDHLWHRANAYVDAGRRAVEAVLARHEELLSWGAGPAAGPIGWVRLRRGSASQYAEALVRSDDGIMLLPSTVFGAGDGHVRVGFGRAASPAVMGQQSEYRTTRPIRRRGCSAGNDAEAPASSPTARPFSRRRRRARRGGL